MKLNDDNFDLMFDVENCLRCLAELEVVAAKAGHDTCQIVNASSAMSKFLDMIKDSSPCGTCARPWSIEEADRTQVLGDLHSLAQLTVLGVLQDLVIDRTIQHIHGLPAGTVHPCVISYLDAYALNLDNARGQLLYAIGALADQCCAAGGGGSVSRRTAAV
jgi:hypothetical protein